MVLCTQFRHFKVKCTVYNGRYIVPAKMLTIFQYFKRKVTTDECNGSQFLPLSKISSKVANF